MSVACGSTRHHERVGTSKEQPGTSEFIAMFWECECVSDYMRCVRARKAVTVCGRGGGEREGEGKKEEKICEKLLNSPIDHDCSSSSQGRQSV